jgi:hypothetical protein
MDTIAVAGGISAYTPSIVGGTGTTTKIFTSLLSNVFPPTGGNPLTAAPTTTKSAVPTSTSGAASLLLRATGEYEQQIVSIRIAGYAFVHGASPTLNFLFQNGTSLTSGSNTTMATLASAQSLTTNATYPWMFKADLQGDSVSGVMQIVGATFACNGVSGTVTSTDLTGISLVTGAGLSFVFGLTFGVSDATNVGVCSQFVLVD